MPEITATQFMTDNLNLWLEGQSITQITITDAANQSRIELEGFPLPSPICRQVWRRGKHSVIPIGEGALVLSYNLSGKVLRASTPESELKGAARTRVTFHLSDGGFVIWKDRINLGELRWFPKRGPEDILLHNFFEQDKSLGPEFWPMHRDGAWWQAVAGHSKRRLLTALMDQKVVAGIGNIIALESLHRVKLPLSTKADGLSDAQWTALANAIRTVVADSLEQHAQLRQKGQRGLDNPRQLRGELKLVAEGHTEAKGFLIYGRAGATCPSCRAGIIQKGKVAGRPTYWCDSCQAE